MARTQAGLVISIKAFIPLTRDLNQNLEALTLAKQAHESGDYSALIAAAQVDEVKVEQRSRRVEDAPVAPPAVPLLEVMGEPSAEVEAEPEFTSRRNVLAGTVDPEGAAA
jgi:hypothetical protein